MAPHSLWPVDTAARVGRAYTEIATTRQYSRPPSSPEQRLRIAQDVEPP